MVDRFEYIDEKNFHSSLEVLPGNMFLDDEGRMAQEGCVEHIAQSAAAFIGYCRLIAGKPVALGYIGDIRKCRFTGTRPAVGDVISTEVRVVSVVGGITMISAVSSTKDGEVASCSMKLAIDGE